MSNLVYNYTHTPDYVQTILPAKPAQQQQVEPGGEGGRAQREQPDVHRVQVGRRVAHVAQPVAVGAVGQHLADVQLLVPG